MAKARTPEIPEIAVVIPTYQRVERLPALLRKLADQSLSPDRFEVIVVDDCSSIDVAAALDPLTHEVPYRLQILRMPRNGGPAAARNVGWRSSSAPLLAFLDDDCTPSVGWLEAGLDALTKQPEVGVMQGCTLPAVAINFRRMNDWYVWRIVEKSEPEFMACNIFYRRKAFEVTGGFDEVIGWWGEDTAAAWKVLEAGWDRGYSADAVATHTVERRGWDWFVRNGLCERNLIRLGVEHPDYREEKYWRPWAYRKEDVAFVAALIGATLAIRTRPALLLALPYLWWRRPSARHLSFFRLCLQIPVVDGARVVGHLRGSLEHRVFVL
jgi:glycosyltransferase involved in cell wall biosynthesis